MAGLDEKKQDPEEELEEQADPNASEMVEEVQNLFATVIKKIMDKKGGKGGKGGKGSKERYGCGSKEHLIRDCPVANKEQALSPNLSPPATGRKDKGSLKARGKGAGWWPSAAQWGHL